MSRVGIFLVYWFSCYIAVVSLLTLPIQIPTLNPDTTQFNITDDTPSTTNATEAITHVEHPLALTTNSVLTSNNSSNSNSTLDPIEEKQTCFSGRCRYPSRCCPGYECSLLQFPPFFSGICIRIPTNPPYEGEGAEEDDDEEDDEEDEEDEEQTAGNDTDADADNQPHGISDDSENNNNNNNNNNSSSNPEVHGNVQQLSPAEHQDLVAIANDTMQSLSLDHITEYVNSIRPDSYLIYSSYYNLYGNPASYNIPGYDKYANRMANHS